MKVKDTVFQSPRVEFAILQIPSEQLPTRHMPAPLHIPPKKRKEEKWRDREKWYPFVPFLGEEG